MLVAAKEHKIVVVGPRKVGKSAMVVRFLTKRFICEYVENTDMSCKRETLVDGNKLNVHIQDTSDKVMTLASIEHHLRWSDAIMMIYSITDEDGFLQIKNTALKMMKNFEDYEDKEQKLMPPLVLVGNKGDLEFARRVSRKEGHELAEKLRCDFFEASAREGWSNLITKSTSLPSFFSNDDIDSTVFASSTTNMPRNFSSKSLQLPPSPARSVSPCNQTVDKSPKKNRNAKDQRSENTSNSSPKRRNGRSLSVCSSRTSLIPKVKVVSSTNRINSFPFCNDSDESELNFVTPNDGGRKFTYDKVFGKLSPRLGRQLIKSNQNKFKKRSRDGNNNKESQKFAQDFLESKRSSMFVSNFVVESSSGELTPNDFSSSSSESLVLLVEKNDNLSFRRPFTSPPLTPPSVLSNLIATEYTSAEPFFVLCRGRLVRQQARSRSRSPSSRLMNGLKKIRSFASDHGSNPGQNAKQLIDNSLFVPLKL